ncbi:hypothetical protein F5Y17DRAFT_454117 [Xylariaceae sp. FL0594]|nr:hypothetical protein F5Y17DRAFT_454117 [Xylariaceae sp. FL0594]
MQFSSLVLVLATAILKGIAAPVPADTAAAAQWAESNNIDVPGLHEHADSDSTASALVDWAKSNDIDVSAESGELVPAPGATDTLAAWAKEHNVEVPSVGANFEGGMDNY